MAKRKLTYFRSSGRVTSWGNYAKQFGGEDKAVVRKIKPGGFRKLGLAMYRAEAKNYGKRIARASVQHAIKKGWMQINTAQAIRITPLAPGGPSSTGKSETMVRAHIAAGHPVRQHVRHLRKDALRLLQHYRWNKGVYGPRGSNLAKKLARRDVQAMIGDLRYRQTGRRTR